MNTEEGTQTYGVHMPLALSRVAVGQCEPNGQAVIKIKQDS